MTRLILLFSLFLLTACGGEVPQLQKGEPTPPFTLEKLSSGSVQFPQQLQGKVVEILIEGKTKGKWQGRTRTGKLVFFSHKNSYPGQTVEIKIEKTSPWSLQGKLAEKTN